VAAVLEKCESRGGLVIRVSECPRMVYWRLMRVLLKVKVEVGRRPTGRHTGSMTDVNLL